MPPPGPSKRFVLILITAAIFVVLLFVTSFRSQAQGTREPGHAAKQAGPYEAKSGTGPSIMPHLGNETAKAELGRATWKYLHTVMARFPDKPTTEESAALASFMHLFQRLYPCGECSEHFKTIIDEYPPQTSSRSAAAAWACHVHNEVNKSLKKELFDCKNIGDFYDCGCAEDALGKDEPTARNAISGKKAMSAEKVEKMTGSNGRSFNEDLLNFDTP